MKKVKSGKIKLSEIKHIENSRMRDKDDVSDLMQDIQQRGLLQPVGVRISDNALLFGNRRVKAYENLDFEEIECIFFDNVSDNDLLIVNVAENIKRKKIGSIEIGRICKILVERGMTLSEISIKLGITKSRVGYAMTAYNITVGTPFEKLVTFGQGGPNRKGIPESLIWKLQEALKRTGRTKLSKSDWNILLNACENIELNVHSISTFRHILFSDLKLSIIKALDLLKESKVVYSYLVVNRQELALCMKEEKMLNEIEYIRKII